jgi:hypothetical protein
VAPVDAINAPNLGGNMKLRIAYVIAIATLSLVSIAQAQTSTMTVVVPFEFTAYDSAMPSGEYSVTKLNERTVSMQLKGGQKSVLLVTDAKELLHSDGIAKLVFNRFGSSYFLTEVWGHGADSARTVRASDNENKIARNQKHTQVAVRAARD